MEERKEINYTDYDKNFKPHNFALDGIKDFNFSEIDKADILSVIKHGALTTVDENDKFEAYTSLVIDENNTPCLSVWLVKHINWINSEQFYILFTPFEVWVRTNTKNIHYKHKALTNAWRKYLLEKFPLYLIPLTEFLEEDRKRLHTIVDSEYDHMLKLFSIKA